MSANMLNVLSFEDSALPVQGYYLLLTQPSLEH